jgi:Fe-Mn family superoxide dismutase
MFTVPELPYAYEALEPFIDAETMRLHHDKHHATYVKNLNDALAGQNKLLALKIDDLMRKLDEVPEAVRTKVRNNGGGHYNHSLFWQVMCASSSKVPGGELAKGINEAFGSFKVFQETFAKAALNRFGSGWAWLALDGGKLIVVDTPNQDSPLMEGKIPILGLDVWEHAYYLKYQNRRVDYINAWWNVVHWDEVDTRFLDALSTV